ncbi:MULTISPECIES: hypothetical protein [unclassified Aurantimonas]|uniref:hypothetical protein n=1 Tax=unclassified Aurantimonas TaxID=2638230 RepID=UPI002E18E49F|nr:MULTISPECIES: hypothetical protein [unclassified Aurantimonas]MEC5322082.1 hypothetical protein [Aurantimonas sp. A3-2-R12]
MIKREQDAANASDLIGLNAARIAGLVKASESFVSKAGNHPCMGRQCAPTIVTCQIVSNDHAIANADHRFLTVDGANNHAPSSA